MGLGSDMTGRMALTGIRPVIFTAMSKEFFYARDAVCQHAFEAGAVPLNPFRAFDYFLGNRVDHDMVRVANNNLIRISDEMWVYGPVADGVLAEILYIEQLAKPLRLFTIADRAAEIAPLAAGDLVFERGVCRPAERSALLDRIEVLVRR